MANLDSKFESEGRTAAMLLDNCLPIQKCLDSLPSLYFLPSNTTSVTQPMDQGIIHNLKCHYRRQLVDKMSDYIKLNSFYFAFQTIHIPEFKDRNKTDNKPLINTLKTDSTNNSGTLNKINAHFHHISKHTKKYC